MLQLKLNELITNLFTELKQKFPKIFVSGDSKNLITYYKQNILLRCKQIIDKIDLSDKINQSAVNVAKYTKIPDFFNNKDHEKILDNFNKVRVIIQRNHSRSVADFSVYDFYVEYELMLKD